MSVSNKTLSILLLVAIVVSLGGTFVSLSRLDAVSTTARATDPTGAVDVAVGDLLSITTADADIINFGTCTLGAGSAGITISSNVTGGNVEDSCSGFTAAYIAVRNNGNVDANVTIQANKIGGDTAGAFMHTAAGIGTTDLLYKITNQGHNTNSGGCPSGIGSSTFASFTAADTEYNACSELKSNPVGGQNSILVDFQIVIPDQTSPTSDTATITFTARGV